MITASAPSPAPRLRRRSSLQRLGAITRAEVLLYLRKPLILLPALLLGPVMVLLLGPQLGSRLEGTAFSAYLVQSLASWALLLVVYYNTTMIAVTRRNEGVYQRMATGQATPWEAFVAACAPSAVIVVVQVLLGTVASALVLFPFPWPNPLLALAGIVGGVVFMAAAAAWTSSWTSDVAAAQFTTIPLLIVLFLASGTVVPAGLLPHGVAVAFSMSPLHAVNDLIGIGLTGIGLTGGDAVPGFLGTCGAAVRPLVVLCAWTVLAILLARATMRFGRRR
ncbi:ABC transporter permease [Actinomyces sp. B33]|uniref:ABC transporter permease n=1 Tax=Actinomyces sp. B33 TaxID=2942131 RepID=UPI002341D948|nr:ABC transporter permease [Actinomyces sp. B33]MDC4233159.1 ABC transporter permease [Actinomyces sp. B33]